MRIPLADIRAHLKKEESGINESFLLAMHNSIDDIADIFLKRKWGVFVSESPVFITSDCPMTLWRGDSLKPNFGFGTPGTQITYPLTPYKLLMIQDSFEEDGLSYPLQDIGGLNDGPRISASRFYFSFN